MADKTTGLLDVLKALAKGNGMGGNALVASKNDVPLVKLQKELDLADNAKANLAQGSSPESIGETISRTTSRRR